MSDRRRDRRFDVLRPGRAASMGARDLRRARRRAAQALIDGPQAAHGPGQGAGPGAQDGPRSDLPGLAALAALAAIAHLVAPMTFPGGFAGIDALFVLLGFVAARGLAGAQAKAQVQAGGRMPWAALIRRALAAFWPPLLAALAAIAALSFWALPPDALARFSMTLVTAPAAAVNIAMAPGAPLTAPAGALPLAHLWAPAAAAQLLAALALLTAVAAPRMPQGFPALLSLLLAASFAYAVQAAPGGLAYTSAAARGWEVLTGALVAAGAGPELRPRIAGAAGIAGAALLGVALAWSPGPSGAPGFPSLAPVAGAALILMAEGRGPVARILSLRPLAALGRNAWGLWLWLPAAAALAVSVRGEGAALGLPLAAAALAALTVGGALAALRRRMRWGVGAGLGLLCAAALVFTGWQGLRSGGAPQRLSPGALAVLEAAAPPFDEERCAASPLFPGCDFGVGIENPYDGVGLRGALAPARVALWGDGAALAALPGVAAAATRAGLRGLSLARPGCPPFIGPNASEDCAAMVAAAPKMAAEAGGRMVVLSGGFARAMARDPGGALQLVAAAEAAHDAGLQVIVLPPPPTLAFDLGAARLRRERFGTPLPPAPSRAAYRAETALLLRAAAAMPPGTVYVDLLDAWCPLDPDKGPRASACLLEDETGAPLYRDDALPTAAGAMLAAPALAQVFEVSTPR
ncbi:SGNH hydrolase domain-containing protein [Rhodovulum sp. DZ06]|uniref:SGNH hydrolase domain-containing protein n=1 Tax=Rhodovulum sp. DZ06 TaxID=3425126 RepID=UPI003D32E77A